jgi:hypothetical protein
MLFQVLEFVTRTYYNLKNSVQNYLFTETAIIPHNQNPLKYSYYYFLINYYLNSYIEYVLNYYFNYQTGYLLNNRYEVSYRSDGDVRVSIIRGNIGDIFNYTRINRTNDEMVVFMKCNIIINGEKTSIRQLLRRYDTRTKLYDIIYYNYQSQVDDINTNIEIEIGQNKYNIRTLDHNLTLERA